LTIAEQIVRLLLRLQDFFVLFADCILLRIKIDLAVVEKLFTA